MSEQRLPDEILMIIARLCVKPWTLVVNEFRVGVSTERDPVLRELPPTANIQLTNMLFRNEIRVSLIRNFDGCGSINQSKISLDRVFHAERGVMWLAPHVTELMIQNGRHLDSFDEHILALTNLKKLTLDLGTPHHAVSLRGRTPVDVVTDLQPDNESNLEVWIVLTEFFNRLTRQVIRNLLRQRTEVIMRLRCFAPEWPSAIVIEWKLDNDLRHRFVRYRLDI